MKVRTALSRPCPAGQTDNGELFFNNPDRIRTANRIETGNYYLNGRDFLWNSLNQSELEIVFIFNSRVVFGAAQVHLAD